MGSGVVGRPSARLEASRCVRNISARLVNGFVRSRRRNNERSSIVCIPSFLVSSDRSLDFRTRREGETMSLCSRCELGIGKDYACAIRNRRSGHRFHTCKDYKPKKFCAPILFQCKAETLTALKKS